MHLSEHKNQGTFAKPRFHEAGAPGTIICPFCHQAWQPSAQAVSAALHELRAWDRRFDGPEEMLDQLLCLLSAVPEKATGPQRMGADEPTSSRSSACTS